MDEFIINSLLCFLNSARKDFTKETLRDIAYAFYSHDEIKSAKTEVCNLLKKDVSWRRDPEKKRKDLCDVIDFLEELTSGRNNWKFLCNSYKGMPPLGIQMIAPLLINLTTEVSKINECLPKFVDIKSEVLNTADTVRKMNIELIDMKQNFTKAVSGIEEASCTIQDDDLHILGEIRSFRRSVGVGRASDIGDLQDQQRDGNQTLFNRDQDLVGDEGPDRVERTGAAGDSSGIPNVTEEGTLVVPSEPVMENVPLLEKDVRSFSEAVKNMKKVLPKTSTISGSSSVREKHNKRPNSQRGSNGNRLTGARKDGGSLLKAVKRTVDVFIGRVDIEADESVIRDYIKDTFDITCSKVEKLQIKTDLYNAFKVTVSLTEREALFKSDMWPEDVIINKFYNRSKKSLENA